MKAMKLRSTSVTVSFVLLLCALALSTLSAYSQDLEAGKRLFEKNCGPCHGLAGEGQLAIPNIAGSAGHVEQLGIAQEGPSALVSLVREGIPGNMPYFPPEVLSDADIMTLGGYLFSLQPTTGANIYTANCALCHGATGGGFIGPPLNTTVEFLQQSGLTREQAVPELAGLVRSGIPGRMPAIPQLTDLEISRLLDHLLTLRPVFPADPAWEAAFRAAHGGDPTDKDRMDRAWSLEFTARMGRAPTDAEWTYHSQRMQPPMMP